MIRRKSAAPVAYAATHPFIEDLDGRPWRKREFAAGGRVKCLLNGSLARSYIVRMATLGFPGTIHPRHIGLRVARDDQIAARRLLSELRLESSS